MKLTLKRFEFTDLSTLGDFQIDGKHFCWVLEDTDRSITEDMTLEEIKAIKIPGKTAIPYGRNEVIYNWSNRFERMMPRLLLVKGFDGVLWHSGNKVSQTDACLLGGYDHSTAPIMNAWEVYRSRQAFNDFVPLLKNALTSGQVFIEIIKA